MYGNTLLQIAAPLIPIFVCMNSNSLFMFSKEKIQNSWKQKEMKVRILSTITIGGSIFLFSFILLFLSSMILFSSSTGSIEPHYGLFKDLYTNTPAHYVFAYIMHSFVFGIVFAFFGVSLKVLIVEPVNLVLFIPLLYYSCLQRIGSLFPINELILFLSPLLTFDISAYDVTPLKRITELLVILVISITLIIISYRRNKRQIKQENEPT
jgi:hypothetical protein